MELKNFDTAKASVLCERFAENAKVLDCNLETILFASMRLFMTILEVITVADPKTGRKYERMRKIAPQMMDAWNADYPIDKEK